MAAGEAVVNFVANTSQLLPGTQAATAAIKQAGDEMERTKEKAKKLKAESSGIGASLKGLKGAIGEESAFGMLGKLALGGGIAGGIAMIASGIEQATAKAEKMVEAFRAGAASANDIGRELVQGLPIIGSIEKTVEHISNMVSPIGADIQQQIASQEQLHSVLKAQLQDARAYDQGERDRLRLAREYKVTVDSIAAAEKAAAGPMGENRGAAARMADQSRRFAAATYAEELNRIAMRQIDEEAKAWQDGEEKKLAASDAAKVKLAAMRDADEKAELDAIDAKAQAWQEKEDRKRTAAEAAKVKLSEMREADWREEREAIARTTAARAEQAQRIVGIQADANARRLRLLGKNADAERAEFNETIRQRLAGAKSLAEFGEIGAAGAIERMLLEKQRKAALSQFSSSTMGIEQRYHAILSASASSPDSIEKQIANNTAETAIAAKGIVSKLWNLDPLVAAQKMTETMSAIMLRGGGRGIATFGP